MITKEQISKECEKYSEINTKRRKRNIMRKLDCTEDEATVKAFYSITSYKRGFKKGMKRMHHIMFLAIDEYVKKTGFKTVSIGDLKEYLKIEENE